MTSERDRYKIAAGRLLQAYDGNTIEPLRDIVSPTDVEGAYAIQAINTDYWQASGRRVVGRKIGLTAKSVQQQLGVDQPDFGVLFEDMRIANGGTLAPHRCIQPKAEAEIALVLAKDILAGHVTRSDIAEATDYALPAIEIVDSRISDWKITFADTVADNGSSAFFVLGEDKKKLDDLDLYTCGMALEANGEIASLGAGAACLGHPLDAAAWLGSTLAAHGTHLKAGDIVLTGALGPMVPLHPGDEVCARIGGVGTCRFTYGN
ncbi:2-keto-4-pentenoate hydratase [Henriciella aquimarina]|uniref:2-keto-4-pentenoate hydratase n=1 Tax=Henriciella aquimarina TaxID=545261 RepID=UPI0009FEABCA|nr:fumarylacetoacetate hydrolase family protein [Henriciella aquimarina]